MKESQDDIRSSTSYSVTDTSERCDLRNSFISRVVPIGLCVHTSAGVSSYDWLCTGSAANGEPASSDWLIDRDGARHKLCADGRRPYHVGRGKFPFASGMKSGDELSAFLLGVELEQTGDQLCTWQQLDSLAELVVLSSGKYGWRWPYFIVGHYQLAIPQGRRSDPQGFDWGAFMGFLYWRSMEARIPGLIDIP
jgi:N-acetyl-anhydromuramyl-L-alanine amidase AmpD